MEFLERIRIQGNSAGKLVTFNFDSSVFTSSLEACSESQQANVNMQVKTSFEILDAVLGAKVHKVEIPQIAKDPKGAESPQGLIALLSRYVSCFHTFIIRFCLQMDKSSFF